MAAAHILNFAVVEPQNSAFSNFRKKSAVFQEKVGRWKKTEKAQKKGEEK